ncbi:MAG: patatin-like phospholipase family protein [Kiritimatiellales bacterium]|nr:patatin-like phospholipase family protein [Kiritimatiellales bacterium]
MSEQRTIALAVAGGGYRATLYSLGALWRLDKFGLLSKLKTITGVSGGSILTGHVAAHWSDLIFNDSGISTNFREVIAEPIQEFCSKSIDIKSLAAGIFSRETIGDKLVKAFDKGLFKSALLQSIPSNGPDFIFYGTNLQTGASVSIQKKELLDYKIGRYPKPDITMAQAVGISTAFPPMLSPVTLKLDPEQWKKISLEGMSEHYDDFQLRKKVLLADGGLYDNLGLEAVWKSKKYTHVLCCDAGAPFKVLSKLKTNWIGQFMRMTSIMTDQQRGLRKRILIERFIDKKFSGTYFGISTKIANYKFDDSMTSDSPVTAELKNLRSRLAAFNEEEQGQLINWGYALADTAIRKHTPELLSNDLNIKGTWPIHEYPF